MRLHFAKRWEIPGTQRDQPRPDSIDRLYRATVASRIRHHHNTMSNQSIAYVTFQAVESKRTDDEGNAVTYWNHIEAAF